jgi:hypothetical protein
MMKLMTICLLGMTWSMILYSQELPPNAEQQLESVLDGDESAVDNLDDLLQFASYIRHPLNLNTAVADELELFGLLTAIQIDHLRTHLKLLGPLESFYELQAIPGWDIPTIRKILPYVTIANPLSVAELFKRRLYNGVHSMILRTSQTNGKEIDEEMKGYNGNAMRMFLKYRYTYKNLFQFGVTGEKDAGERFFSGRQKTGFDFYSYHVFARKLGKLEALALGDFTVNMGQGLIHWQSLAFKKSAGVMNIKRQSPTLRAYNSAGEYNFHRGVAACIRIKAVELTAFVSFHRLSAHIRPDSVSTDTYFSSVHTSGLHRTDHELDAKSKLKQLAAGVVLKVNLGRLKIAVNGVGFHYSSSFRKGPEPYAIFAIRGDRWINSSIDYGYTHKNFHIFGEFALDRNGHRASINGLMISANAKVDLSLVHRAIEKEYQSLYGNSITENTMPSNEEGIYFGVVLHPVRPIRVEAYADFSRFPWLKYGIDAPSRGKDFLGQVTYAPSRNAEIYIRYRVEEKEYASVRKSVRIHWSNKVNASLTFRNRTEFVQTGGAQSQVRWTPGNASGTGFLSYFDIIYNPPLKPFSTTLRCQYFETSDFDSRVYAYENDVLFSNSLPAFSGRGYRYYLLFRHKIRRTITVWLRWSATVLPDKPAGSTREWKVQLSWER